MLLWARSLAGLKVTVLSLFVQTGGPRSLSTCAVETVTATVAVSIAAEKVTLIGLEAETLLASAGILETTVVVGLAGSGAGWPGTNFTTLNGTFKLWLELPPEAIRLST